MSPNYRDTPPRAKKEVIKNVKKRVPRVAGRRSKLVDECKEGLR